MGLHRIFRVMAKHSPEILAGLGVGGTIATVIFGITATPKAEKVLDELYAQHSEEAAEAEEKGVEYKVPKTEVVKAVLPVYLPTIGMGVLTIVCIVGSTVASKRRIAMLESLYSAAEVALTTYQHKVVEKIGEKAEEKVRHEIAEDKVERQPATSSQVVFTGNGDTLFYDYWSGRYFKSDYERVRSAVNDLNSLILSDMWATVNDFYYYLGIPPADCGKNVGFNPDHKLDIIYTAIHADDMTPCTALQFRERPRTEDTY